MSECPHAVLDAQALIMDAFPCSGTTRQMTADQVRQLRYLAQAKLQQQAVAAGNGNSPSLDSAAAMGPPGSAATAALLNRNLGLAANRSSPGGAGTMLPPGTTQLQGNVPKRRPTTAAEAIDLARSGRLTEQQKQHILQQLQVRCRAVVLSLEEQECVSAVQLLGHRLT